MKKERNKDAFLHLSTQDGRLVGTNKWHIPVDPNVLHGRDIVQLLPVVVTVPNVFPNVRAPYNTFTIQDATNVGVVTTITIAEAFYTGTEVAAALNAALVAAGFTDVTFSYNSLNTNQSEFRVTNNSATIIYNIDVVGTLDRIVGVTPTTSATFPLAELTTTSFGRPNLAGERVVHIRSEKLGHTQGLHSESGMTDLCVTIPLTSSASAYGGIGTWSPNDKDSTRLDMQFDVNLANGVDVSLWDHRMLPLSLPSNFEIELQFKIIHSPNIL
jgi:hypothetical protein